MKIETVLIDAGGIILDETEYEESCAEHITKAINHFGISYKESDYRHDYKEGIISFCPQSRQYVIWKNANHNLTMYNKIWNRFINEWKRPPLKLMSGIKSVLLDLSNQYSLILAGQYGAEIYNLLETNGINCFSNSLSQDDFTITKPDSRYLEQIAIKSNINLHNAVMIGDRIDNDIIPATQLGMKSILVRSSVYKIQQPRTPTETPSMTIDSVNEIPQSIKDLLIRFE